MPKPTPSELLTLLAERAKALRDAGVSEFSIEGLSAKLSASPTVVQIVNTGGRAPGADEGASDPLDDSATFGLPPGAPVPGFDLEELQRLREGRES